MRRSTLLLVGLLIGHAPSLLAEEPEPPRWRITPYLWVPEIEGSTTADEEEAEGTLTFFDVLEAFGFVGLENDSDPWGFRGDLMFLSLDGEWDRPPDTGFELDILILEFTGSYRVIDGDGTRPWVPDLDLSAGIRFYSTSVELELVGSDAEGSRDWIDPIFGARSVWELGDSWGVEIAGDIGGFDVGSELAWQASAGLGYEFSRTFTLEFIYRILDLKAPFGSRDRYEIDLQLRGPMLAFQFTF